ncbi:MAG: ABC transporter substrate-binding protein [Selenomonadaceae bacterium]|nr:ABC transporter substrate-binding protein [Selenomonadaceae bacterium]
MLVLKKILLLMALAMLMVGCGDQLQEPPPNPDPAKPFAILTDQIGRQVTFKVKPERIAVTSAGFLEPLHQLDGNIVGRPDSRTQMPEWAKSADIASIGPVYQIDVELLIACRPDLVIINKGMNEKLLGVLSENNIHALVLDMKTFGSFKRVMRTFAILTDNESKGEDMIADMERRIDDVIETLPKENHRVAILHSTAQGLSVQLEGSIAGDIVKKLGWTNVADGMTPLENNPDAAPYSMETLAEQNPEIIFVTSMGPIDEIKADMENMIAGNEAWRSIGAVRDGRVYYLPQDLFLLSPGLRYPEAFETIAQLIYPTLFPTEN